MPRIPINFADVPAVGGFPVYPAGEYTLRVAEVRVETAKSSNEPKLTVFFEIVDGPNGSLEYVNQRLLRSYSLQASALGFCKRLLVACGLTDEALRARGGFPDTEDLIGAMIKAAVSTRQYQGRDTNDVSGERPANSPATGATPSVPAAFVAPPTPAAFVAPSVPAAATPVAPAATAATPVIYPAPTYSAPGFPGVPGMAIPPAPPPPPASGTGRAQ